MPVIIILLQTSKPVLFINYSREVCVFPHFRLIYINAGGIFCEKNKKTNTACISEELHIRCERKAYSADGEHPDAVHAAGEAGLSNIYAVIK